MYLKVAAVAVLGLSSLAALASPLMPSFATAPTDWTTDRYAPDSFGNVGTYQGRNDVLGIGISSDDALANRPAGYQSAFYNTQGMQYAVTGGAGSSIAADLFIDSAWRDGSNGNVRSDMWGVMDGGSVGLQYPIIGFTNYGGSARYRVWDGDAPNGWVDLSTTVAFGAWTSFEILFTGSAFEFLIDDVLVYTDSTVYGSTGFSALIMQAYNFGDPGIAGATATNYVAHWSNAEAGEVPEPATLALVGLSLLGLAATRRRA